MPRKSFVTMAALVVGLALGMIFGPSVAGLSANARTQPPTQTQTPVQGQPQAARTTLHELFLNQLAAALNIQRSMLDSAITSAGNSTADTAVQQGTLTQAQADALKARIQDGDLGALWGGRGSHVGGPKLGGVHQAMFDAAAKTLNMTADELRQQLRSGQTLARLAQATTTTEQAVTSAALAAAKAQLDQAVSDGTLTQSQAISIYAELQQRGLMLKSPGGRGRQLRGVPAIPALLNTPASPQPSSTNL